MCCSLLRVSLLLFAPASSIASASVAPSETLPPSSCKRRSCNSQWLLQRQSSVSQGAQLFSKGASSHDSERKRKPSKAAEVTESMLKDALEGSGAPSEEEERQACKATGPADAFVRFVQVQAPSAAASNGGYATGSRTGVMGGKPSGATSRFASVGRDGHKGRSNGSTIPGAALSPDSLGLDFTNAFQGTDRISILVTVVVESGTYIDGKGFAETYGDNVGLYLELKVDRDRSQIDVYMPQMSIRTSDTQSVGAVRKGAGDGWIDVLPMSPCPAASDADRIIVGLSSLVSKGFYLADVSQSVTSNLERASAYPSNFDITIEYLDAAPTKMGFSVSLLPSTPMLPRDSDDRLLFFTTQYTDMGSHKPSPKLLPWQSVDKETSLIWRWDVSKLLNRTIRVYIDPTVPERWRQAFKEGVEAWNDAFEKIEQPVRVQGVLPGSAGWPEDYDISDARFSAVAWSISDEALSIGNAKVDPRSGEIIKADITMSDKWVSAYLRELDSYDVVPNKDAAISMSRAMLAAASIASTPSNEPEDRRSQVFSTGLGLLLAQRAQQQVETEKPDLEEILSSGLRNIVMHETGHILGLRHNFKGSLAASKECLQDIACTAKEGIGSSVMDYVPINLPKPGGPKVHAFSPVIGGYDKLAIRYGYAPALELPGIVAEAELLYPTCYDEEELHQDPFCAPYDLGENPVDFIEDKFNLLAHLQDGLLNRSVLAGQPFVAYGNAVESSIKQAFSMGLDLTTYVGGVQTQHRRAKAIAADGRQHEWARMPVPVKVQRQALQLLIKILHPDKAGLLPPTRDWRFLVEGEPQGDYMNSLDLGDILENLSQQVMSTLISGPKLQQVRFQEQLVSDSQSQSPAVLSVSELLTTVDAGVLGFSPKDASASHTNLSHERNSLLVEWGLQKTFVAALKDLYLDKSLPEELTTDILVELHAVQTALLQAGPSAGSTVPSSITKLQAHLDLMSRDLSEVFCLTGDVCGAPRVPFRVSSGANVRKIQAPNETAVRKDAGARMLPSLIALGLSILLRCAN